MTLVYPDADVLAWLITMKYLKRILVFPFLVIILLFTFCQMVFELFQRQTKEL